MLTHVHSFKFITSPTCLKRLQQRQSNSTYVEIKLSTGVYRVDLRKMIQTNVNTKYPRWGRLQMRVGGCILLLHCK